MNPLKQTPIEIINNALDAINANSLLKPFANISNILPSSISNSNLDNYFQILHKTQNGVLFSLKSVLANNIDGIINLIVSASFKDILVQKQISITGFKISN